MRCAAAARRWASAGRRQCRQVRRSVPGQQLLIGPDGDGGDPRKAGLVALALAAAAELRAREHRVVGPAPADQVAFLLEPGPGIAPVLAGQRYRLVAGGEDELGHPYEGVVPAVPGHLDEVRDDHYAHGMHISGPRCVAAGPSGAAEPEPRQ